MTLEENEYESRHTQLAKFNAICPKGMTSSKTKFGVKEFSAKING